MKYLPILAIPLLFTACDQIQDVNGSFEESQMSPRIGVNIDSETYRFFRFHLRQFNDSVSGTFETFDMANYELFNQVPILMNNPLSLYYCARIDYGYIRNNTVHIVFTDREQRRWIFSAKLGQDSLNGTINRTNNHTGSFDILFDTLKDPDYMLPEDASYMQINQTNASQINLESMKDSSASLNCIYYYKSFAVNFVLPDSFPFEECKPSTKQCHNYRLAIIGMPPLRKVYEFNPAIITEVTSAYLDDCDMQDSYKRNINLRDNPNTSGNVNADYFIATAIVYEDLDMNGSWDANTEPILASLDNQSIIFFNTISDSPIYGESPDGSTYQAPVLSSQQLPDEPGYHLYNDESDPASQTSIMRVLKHLTPATSNVLSLKAIHLDATPDQDRGCYLHPEGSHQASCNNLIPILVQ